MSFQQIPIPDTDESLMVTWTTNGLPLFVADRPDVCDIVEAMGFSIYYLLANHQHSVSVTNKNSTGSGTYQTTKQVTTSQILKVVNNIVGRVVVKDNPALDPMIIAVPETALYNMPSIPTILIDKLDQFFRMVDASYGTESIVLLTYDTTCSGPEGWGILVPDQTNTSVHCNYDPGSVLEHKPDDCLIVGSVHSHPGMAAYASGTDHGDQADFDGIHITFGWQKSVNNGATQYHIEMQMAGTAYTLKPEDVFEDYNIAKDPDPEVVGWTERVKKVLPPSPTAGVPMPSAARHIPQSKTTKQSSTTAPGTLPGTRTDTSSVPKTSRFENFPQVWKNLGEDNIIIAEILASDKMRCPSCSSDVSRADLEDGYCFSCTIPIIEANDFKTRNIDSVMSDLAYWCYQFNYSLDAKVWLWVTENKTKNELIPVLTQTLHDYMYSSRAFVDSSADDLDDLGDAVRVQVISEIAAEQEMSKLDKDFLLCCGRYIEDSNACQCSPQVWPEDVLDFDTATHNVNQYTSGSQCNECANFYDPHCPSYFLNLQQFVTDRSIPAFEFERTIDGVDCVMFQHYDVRSAEESFADSLWDRD